VDVIGPLSRPPSHAPCDPPSFFLPATIVKVGLPRNGVVLGHFAWSNGLVRDSERLAFDESLWEVHDVVIGLNSWIERCPSAGLERNARQSVGKQFLDRRRLVQVVDKFSTCPGLHNLVLGGCEGERMWPLLDGIQSTSESRGSNSSGCKLG
jgi:hypothetical protein